MIPISVFLFVLRLVGSQRVTIFQHGQTYLRIQGPEYKNNEHIYISFIENFKQTLTATITNYKCLLNGNILKEYRGNFP